MAGERTTRLVARRKAKEALRALRVLVRILAEWERLEADAVGVVSIEPGEGEGDYGPDVLDMVAQAVADAGHSRVVEVFVTSAAAEHRHRAPEAHRRDDECPRASTQTPAPPSASAAPSP